MEEAQGEIGDLLQTWANVSSNDPYGDPADMCRRPQAFYYVL